MSRLRIYAENHAEPPLSVSTDHAEIERELAAVGVRFEQWAATKAIVPGASQDEVIAAYRSDIDRLMQEEGLPGRRRDQPEARSSRARHVPPEIPQRTSSRRGRSALLRRRRRPVHLAHRRQDLRSIVRTRRPDRRAGQYAPLVRHERIALLRRHPPVHQPGRLGRQVHREDIAERFPRMAPHASAKVG